MWTGMDHTPLAARLGLWRVTRQPAVRRLYDALERAGLILAQLDRFERGAISPPETPAMPEDLNLTVSAATNGVPESLGDDPIAPEDRIIRAEQSGRTVGRCCLSDRPVYVPELRRRFAFDGTYLWRLYVDPSQRRRGIGTALITKAVAITARETDHDLIVALVALDNLPSRKGFRALDFEPTVRYTTVGWGRRRYYRRRGLADGRNPE